jgi:hypothetical protein
MASQRDPAISDRLLELAECRRKSPALEMRWLNLCGFMLRPGFGFPGDDFRIEQARRIYAGGLQFANQVQNEIDWWIFWGRVAGGLNKNQQVDIFQRLSPVLLPRGSSGPRDQQQPAARNVAHRREPGAASVADQDAARRRADRASEERRDGGDRLVVPVAAGRAEAVLRAHQSSAAVQGGDALGGSSAQSPES